MSTLDLSTVQWRKSSRSGSQGGQCVEIAGLSTAQWRKSGRSSQGGQDCVEVAGLSPVVAVRDSKDPEGPKLILDAAAWRSLTRHVRTSAG
ncbi:DUF397 domain-containing protein [Actinomadura oligospora]|uniref:DUF397 domain-containing protein n=1 Tax=Actinomadura oligospora TaxID=111804 RepID=UPI0009FC2B09|nr:DUF397 domain-containing protein [Actinomadura oligospora]